MEPLTLHHPFTAICSGASGSGKTFFLKSLLEHRDKLIKPLPKQVIWFYGESQPLHGEIEDVEFRDDSDFEEVRDALLIFDDLMSELSGDEKLSKLFTKYSHHRNLSVIFITQNFFHKGLREITLNAHYIFLFRNRRDLNQITNLGRQLYPTKLKFFQQSYEDSTKEPYSYLLIDLKQETPEKMRLRSGVLPTQTSTNSKVRMNKIFESHIEALIQRYVCEQGRS